MRAMEDFAYVLDVVPIEFRSARRRVYTSTIVQAVGEKEFRLFELIPKPSAVLVVGERVYIGRDLEKRDKIAQVYRKIRYDDLTPSAKAELPGILEQIVRKREAEFVRFFNEAAPITARLHTLELLPGIGKRMMWKIVEERRKKPFESFEDIERRTKLKRPCKVIVDRIIEELKGVGVEFRLFTR